MGYNAENEKKQQTPLSFVFRNCTWHVDMFPWDTSEYFAAKTNVSWISDGILFEERSGGSSVGGPFLFYSASTGA